MSLVLAFVAVVLAFAGIAAGSTATAGAGITMATLAMVAERWEVRVDDREDAT